MLRKSLYRSLILICLFIFTTFAHAKAESATTAYIINDHSMQIFDPANDALVGNINGAKGYIYKVDVSLDGKVAYAILDDSQNHDNNDPFPVIIINTKTRQFAGTVSHLPTDKYTSRHSIAIAPNNLFAYVGEGEGYNFGIQQIQIIDTSTHSFMGTVQGFPTNFHASHIGITPDSQKALVVDTHGASGRFNQPSLLFINTKTHTVSSILPASSHYPNEISITPDGKKAYLTTLIDSNEWEIMVIDVAAEKVSSYITANAKDDQTVSIAITPDSQKVYVLHGNQYTNDQKSYISIIDTNTDTIIGEIKFTFPADSDPSKIAISPDGKKAYVTYEDENAHLTVIDLATNSVSTLKNPAFNGAYDMVFFTQEA